MPSLWLMPSEYLPARLSAAESIPTMASTSSTRRAGMSLVAASHRRWSRPVRAGWNALTSSSAPTSRRGQRS